MYMFYVRKGYSMKHNKILGLLGIAAALTLVACGGGNNKTSKAAGKTSKAPTSRAPVSREPQPEITLTTQEIAKSATDNKVYVSVAGTSKLYTAEKPIKLAWGLVADNTWAYGSESPEAADFKAEGVTFDAATGAFSAKLCITDIANIPGGNYKVYAGTSEDSGFAYGALTVGDGMGNINDGTYRYYYRDDITSVAIEQMPPISMDSATIVEKTFGEGDTAVTGRFLKIGGAKNATVTAEAMATWSPYCDFEPVPYSSSGIVRLSNNESMFLAIEGDNAYAYLRVDSLVQGTNYLVHFNHNGGKVNLFMNDAMADTPFENADANIRWTLYANPDAGQAGGAEEFYGCLAVKVAYINEPVAPVEGE